MMKKYLLFALLLVLFWGKSFSQDLHYTQFYNTPMNFNPSLTGIYNGDQRYMVSIRDQWRKIPIPYLTVTGSYDMKFFPKQFRKSFFSAGLIFNYDRQGDARLNLSNLNLAGNYSYVLSKNSLLSVGGLLGFATRGFSDKNLRWDAYYDDQTGEVNTGRPSLEVLNNYRFNFVETGLGVNYRWQKHRRTHVTAGVAGFHLTRPPQEFNKGVTANRLARLSIRYVMHAVANIKIADPLDIQFSGLIQRQKDYKEMVFGGLLKVYLNKQRGKQLAFHLGASVRLADAIIPKIAIQYNDIYVGFSYDVNTSALQNYTNSRGGPELHINYIFRSVPPLKAFKLCPIF